MSNNGLDIPSLAVFSEMGDEEKFAVLDYLVERIPDINDESYQGVYDIIEYCLDRQPHSIKAVGMLKSFLEAHPDFAQHVATRMLKACVDARDFDRDDYFIRAAYVSAIMSMALDADPEVVPIAKELEDEIFRHDDDEVRGVARQLLKHKIRAEQRGNPEPAPMPGE